MCNKWWQWHRWNYFREVHKATGLPCGVDKVDLYVKQCLNCGKRFLSPNHPQSSLFKFSGGWKNSTIKPGQILNLKEIK
jgi:hypothetical protein